MTPYTETDLDEHAGALAIIAWSEVVGDVTGAQAIRTTIRAYLWAVAYEAEHGYVATAGDLRRALATDKGMHE